MTRCYAVNLAPTAIAVATTDLIAVLAATDIPIKIRSIKIWQITDFGDAQDEVLTIQLVRGNTTAGTGGATATPVLTGDKHDAAASFTARTADTTAASAGTTDIPYQTGWNVRSVLEWIFPESDMPRGDAGGGRIVLRLGAAPADSLTIGAQLVVWEV